MYTKCNHLFPNPEGGWWKGSDVDMSFMGQVISYAASKASKEKLSKTIIKGDLVITVLNLGRMNSTKYQYEIPF